MKNIISHFLIYTILLITTIALFYLYGKQMWKPYYEKYSYQKPQTVIPCEENNISEISIEKLECNLTHFDKNLCPELTPCPIPEVLSSKQKLKRHLADSDFVIYPKNLTLIGLKHEKILEVWTKKNGKYIHIVSYPFTAFSGILGPKFREGDRQIPEGMYKISYLNPNSKFHLSMRINYPNTFDKKMAKKEKRTHLGGDIMIHGSDKTIGCIPIGNDKIEELYFLAEKVGIQNINVILAPVDFRQMEVKIKKNDKHPWLKDLYAKIKKEMKPFISK